MRSRSSKQERFAFWPVGCCFQAVSLLFSSIEITEAHYSRRVHPIFTLVIWPRHFDRVGGKNAFALTPKPKAMETPNLACGLVLNKF